MSALVLALVLAGFEPDAFLPGKPWALKGHTDSVVAVAFSRDGQRLVSAGRDRSVRVWNPLTGELVQTLTVESAPTALALSPDGARVALGYSNLQFQLLELSTGKGGAPIAHPDIVSELAFSPDGALLAVAGAADTGALYDVGTGAKRADFRGRTASFTADGKLLLIANGAGSFSVLDGRSGKVKKTVSTGADKPLTSWSADGQLGLAWNPSSVDAKLWRPSSSKPVGVLTAPLAAVPNPELRPRVTALALSADGARAVVATADRQVRLWDTARRAPLATWPADNVPAVALSPDKVWIAVADGGLVKLWKVP